MQDPYRMVFVNLAASLVLIFGVLFYKYVFPKKNIDLFALLLLVSILPLLSLLRPGDYESGDFNIHIYRIMSFYDSLREGHLMPSWAGELNATYGNPLFIFNYSLPYYIISFLHFMGISFISSMKIYLGLTLYLSGIFMFMWVKRLTNIQLAAFTSAIFYLFNPYHLIDVHFRATLGETTIFTLVPLLLYFVTLFIQKRKLIYLPFIGLISQLLFLAHPMVAGIFIIISALFAISINIKKEINNIFFVFIALAIGAIGSIYSWVSFLIYSPYMFSNPIVSVFQDTFSGLAFSPWRYGFLFQGPNGELAYIIGYTQIFVAITVIYLLFKKRVSKKLMSPYIFWLFIFFTVLFFMSPYSKTIWASLPFLSMLQSNRLLLPIALCTSVLAGYLAVSFSNTKKREMFIYILLLITIGYTILNWGHRRVIPEINDRVLRSNVWKSTVTEGVTAYFLNNKWADINNFWFSELPKEPLEIIEGKGTVIQIQRTPTKHTYIVNAQSPLVIKESTLYFPGWSLKSNDEQITTYPGKRGVINARIPKGLQKLDLQYNDLPVYRFSKIISASTFSILLIILIFLSMPRRLSSKPQHFTRNIKSPSRSRFKKRDT